MQRQPALSLQREFFKRTSLLKQSLVPLQYQQKPPVLLPPKASYRTISTQKKPALDRTSVV